MGVYTTPSHPTPTIQKAKWDPSRVLGIINTDPVYQCITCVGYAPSQRRRCRMAIRADNRSFILQTLDEISYWSPDNPAVISRLRTIAGSALCVRFHQSQEKEILQGWKEKIRELNVENEEEHHVKPSKKMSRHINTDRLSSDMDRLDERFASMEKMLEELLREQRYQREDSERKEKEKIKKERKSERGEERKSERRKREEKEREEEERKQRERKQRERKQREREERQREEREREEQRRRASEQAASNERIRQRAQKRREERERLEREKVQKERDTWDQLWTGYQTKWEQFTACTSRVGDIGNAIPWPVKGGLKKDVDVSAVEEFMKMAPPKDANVSKLMRKESRKWHPDAVKRWLRDAELSQADKERVDMICRVVTDVLNGAAGRTSDFQDL